MADFFEQLGKKISDVAEDFGKKTEDTLEVQRIKARSVLWIVPMKEITSKSERRFIKNSKQEKWRT